MPQRTVFDQRGDGTACAPDSFRLTPRAIEQGQDEVRFGPSVTFLITLDTVPERAFDIAREALQTKP